MSIHSRDIQGVHMSLRTVKCYIEEYRNESGAISARLREKGTGHKVDLGFTGPRERRHFIEFLSAAARHRNVMPDVFTPDGEDDYIRVTGRLDFDSPDEIRFIYDEHLEYVFA